MANFRYLEDSTDKFKQLFKVTKSGFGVTSVVAEDLEEGNDAVKELRDIMIDYASMERDVKNYLKAAEDARRDFEGALRTQEDNDEGTPDFHSLFEEKLLALESKNKPEDLLKHNNVKAFDDTVMKQHFGVEETNDAGPEEERDDDIEIQMTQADDTQKFICPITKVELVKPVKNICGHTYSRVAIETHLRNNKNRNARCPVAGCVHLVTRDGLEDNTVLAYEIRQKHKN